jgi:hypothetical protein
MEITVPVGSTATVYIPSKATPNHRGRRADQGESIHLHKGMDGDYAVSAWPREHRFALITIQPDNAARLRVPQPGALAPGLGRGHSVHSVYLVQPPLMRC